MLERDYNEDGLDSPFAEAGQNTMHGSEIIFLVFCVVFGFFLRQLIDVRLFPDSIDYLTFARNILSGTHNTGDISFLASFRRPPLYPHLIALFSGGNSTPILLVEIARQISVIFGALVVIPIYFLTRAMASRGAAMFSVLMAVLIPEFVYYSGAVLAESMCLFFVSVSFVLLWYAHQDTDRWYLHILLGIFLGASFLCRHLAIGFLGLSILWMVVSNIISIKGGKTLLRYSKTGASCLIIVSAFVVTISPQILYLHGKTGKWALAVDPFSSSAMKIKHEGADIRYTAMFESRAAINESGDGYVWEEKKSSGLVATIKAQPLKYLKSFLSTIFRGYLTDTYPIPYPKVLCLLSALGIAAMIIRRRYRILIFCLYFFAGYYLFLGLFLTMRDRYMFLAYPFILIAAGFGAENLLWLVRRLGTKFNDPKWIHRGFAVLLFLVIAGSLLPLTNELIKEQNNLGNKEYFMAISEDLSRKIEKNAFIFDRAPHLAYFVGGTKVTPPYAKIDNVLHFARVRGVRYWVVSTYYVPSLRPQYEPLLDPKKPHEGLRPIAVYDGGIHSKTVVYEILQE